MAKTVITTDDIDGSTEAESIEFSYSGVTYSIDLAKKNRTAFENALKPYIAAAHPASAKPSRSSRATAAKPRRGRSGRTGASGRDLSVVRAWAHEQGIAVSERGRVARDVLDAYDAAH
jgi:hypothetical protein